MDGHAQPRGGFTRLEDSAYNSRLVGMFFGVLGTVSAVAISAAIIVSALVGQPAGAQLHGMSGMTAPASAAPAVTAPAATAPGASAPASTAGPDRGAGLAGTGRAGGGREVGAPRDDRRVGSVGPDGKLHEAFASTNYAVQVGGPISLVVNNTDSAPHTITAPAVGVNIVVRQVIHAYTLVGGRAGWFLWFCALPCDIDAHGWAIWKAGFMSGYITAS